MLVRCLLEESNLLFMWQKQLVLNEWNQINSNIIEQLLGDEISTLYINEWREYNKTVSSIK